MKDGAQDCSTMETRSGDTSLFLSPSSSLNSSQEALPITREGRSSESTSLYPSLENEASARQVLGKTIDDGWIPLDTCIGEPLLPANRRIVLGMPPPQLLFSRNNRFRPRKIKYRCEGNLCNYVRSIIMSPRLLQTAKHKPTKDPFCGITLPQLRQKVCQFATLLFHR
eukprot:Gregarina_sp_Poly_1__736@NODE_1176_length_4862_cov_123_404380_g806_i0_p2_GENE_NODE_1176_length_4862_cov_123_404380_g806_i0NODE_1176_length_4862_cov_123_404380_g806_i0_p2_ORF_typecomplete_len168_score16_78_NODE_1176_length_4862_cov_123_404380_g806_i041144617